MTTELDELQRRIVTGVDQALTEGLELRRWWLRARAANDFPNRYEESFVFNRPSDTSFGFYGDIELPSGRLAMNGNVQRMFYDGPKGPALARSGDAQWMQRQIREFILHYFLRVSDFRDPQQVPEGPPLPPGLRLLSQCPKDDPQLIGFGFTQLLYKRVGSGEIGVFSEAERNAIIDVRRLGSEFEWIVLENPIFDFNFTFAPLGVRGPRFVLPLPESNYLVMSRGFVVDEERPEPGILGRYGIGYAFVRNPGPPGIFAYGPGELQPAFEQLDWEVHENGEVFSEAVFVANQPRRLLNVSLDPLQWGLELADTFSLGAARPFLAPARALSARLPDPEVPILFPALDLLNLFTLNQAARLFCISRLQIVKDLLFVHFQQHYQTILGSLQTWRQVPDWLDRAALPSFVITGKST